MKVKQILIIYLYYIISLNLCLIELLIFKYIYIYNILIQYYKAS